MNKPEYLEYFDTFIAEMRELTRKKNADYTGTSGDPFANFTSSEVVAGVTTLQGLLVRMGDKMARIKSFSQKGFLEVTNETVRDSFMDLAVYSILASAYVESQKVRVPMSVRLDCGDNYSPHLTST